MSLSLCFRRETVIKITLRWKKWYLLVTKSMKNLPLTKIFIFFPTSLENISLYDNNENKILIYKNLFHIRLFCCSFMFMQAWIRIYATSQLMILFYDSELTCTFIQRGIPHAEAIYNLTWYVARLRLRM